MHRTGPRTPSSNLFSQPSSQPALFVICVALAGGVLAVDFAMPLGFAGGIPYVAVVILASRFAEPRSVYVAAAACTGLALLGYSISEAGPDRAMAIGNRILTGFALWITAVLMHGYTRSETALKDSQERFRTLYERAPAMLHSIDEKGRIVSVSDQWLRFMGYAREEVIGQELAEFISEDGRDRARESDLPAFYRTGKIDDLEYRFIKKDGTIMEVLLSAIARYDDRRRFAGSLSVLVDITDRKRAERALRDEKERAQVTLQSIGDAVITTDGRGYVQYLNPAAESLTGWPNAEARGEPLQSVFRVVDESTRTMAPDPVATCLVSDKPVALTPRSILIARDGRERAIEDSASPIRGRDGEVHGVVVVFHDVTESRRLARKLAHQASHDALTGLINRREFERRLQRVLETTKAHGGEHALCYLDLDQFKVVNDTCGHIAGDELLRELRGVLKAKTRKRDTLARLGGDEFGLLMEHCNLEQAARVADELREAVEQFRFVWEDKAFSPGVSIGLVPITDDKTTVKNVLASADAACYAAKSAGRNRVHIYRSGDADLERHHGDIRWVMRIQRALENDSFEIHLQPIVPVQGDGGMAPRCYEALLRLSDAPGTRVRPGAFLPAAERYDLSRRIDRWVVRTALRWLSENDRFTSDLSALFINLSGRTLADERFLDFVNDQFAGSRVSPEKICFEITETSAIGNLSSATRLIRALRAKGCLFALDDFGSGLSSLAYLKNLPVDFIKIDGTFVKDVDDDPVSATMVRSINEISRVMDIRTIAEFVETEKILEAVRRIGVDHAQGYHIGKPRPLDLQSTPEEAQSG